MDIRNDEKEYIENKEIVKEENKWSVLGSRIKNINIMLYDIIFQLRKLVEVVRPCNINEKPRSKRSIKRGSRVKKGERLRLRKIDR